MLLSQRAMFLRPLAIPLLLWATLTGLVVLANRDPLLVTEIHETGDFAVNALQIHHAKSGAEIYGNYSRFHFHHPGPAFFYVYALGERLLVDALALVPSPFNAHVIFGIALQAAFFVLALHLLAGRLDGGRTWVLGLVVGALHFGHVSHAFTGIWPPEVLLMPFLAFFAAVVSIASGRLAHVPWAVLAGSFLVHGHVAQPLFVGTLFLLALHHARRDVLASGGTVRAAVRAHRPAFLLAGGILAVFLIPLLIDLLQGAPNFRRILLHLHGQGGGGKGPVQSALYFLTFTTRTAAPEDLLHSVGWHSFAFVRERPLQFVLWVASVALFGWGARRDAASGLRRLWQYWLITVGLCLVWGLLQAGPMYAFNGFFYHGIHFIAYLGAATTLLRLRPLPALRWWAAPAIAAALGLAFLLVRIPAERIDHGGLDLRRSTAKALALDPHPDRPKLLVFPHDYWGHAASVALALERAGESFRVEPEMEFMFETRSTATAAELTQPDVPFSVWRFVPAERSATGPLILHGRGIAFAPDALPPDGGVIPFGADDGFVGYHLAGISGGQNGMSWTKDPNVLLQFRPGRATRDVILTLEARPYTHPRGPSEQRVEVRFNGVLRWTGSFAGPDQAEIRIPAALWNEREIAHLWLHLPDAAAPVWFGNSGDWRILALEMTRFTTRLAGTGEGPVPIAE